MKNEIAILIPCFNERHTIEKVVSEFMREVPDATIYVYDNNSSDGSELLAQKAGAIVRHEFQQGKGNVVRSMFQQIDADCYVLVDGDDTYPASEVRKLITPILFDGVDMVVGDRLSSTYFSENKRAFHNFGNVLVRFLINKIFNSNNKDIMSGYRAFNKKFVKNFPILGSGFELEIEMTIHALDKKFTIREFPIQYKDRPKDSYSKLNTFSDGIKVIRTIFRLFKDLKPLPFFGYLSVIGLLVALIADIPVFATYLDTGLVPRFPTLILSGVVIVASLLLLVCGIILDTVIRNHKQSFELQLIRWQETQSNATRGRDEL